MGARARVRIAMATESEGREALATDVGGMEGGVDVVPQNGFPLLVSPKHHVVRQPPLPPYFRASLMMRRMYASMSATRSGWAWATTAI